MTGHTCYVSVPGKALHVLSTDPDYMLFVDCDECGRHLPIRFLSHTPFEITRRVVLESRQVEGWVGGFPWDPKCRGCRPLQWLWGHNDGMAATRSRLDPDSIPYTYHQLTTDTWRHFALDHGINVRKYLDHVTGAVLDRESRV